MAELLAEELSAHGIAVVGRSTCETIIAAVIQRAACPSIVNALFERAADEANARLSGQLLKTPPSRRT
jgi:hypothetical protein